MILSEAVVPKNVIFVVQNPRFLINLFIFGCSDRYGALGHLCQHRSLFRETVSVNIYFRKCSHNLIQFCLRMVFFSWKQLRLAVGTTQKDWCCGKLLGYLHSYVQELPAEVDSSQKTSQQLPNYFLVLYRYHLSRWGHQIVISSITITELWQPIKRLIKGVIWKHKKQQQLIVSAFSLKNNEWIHKTICKQHNLVYKSFFRSDFNFDQPYYKRSHNSKLST